MDADLSQLPVDQLRRLIREEIVVAVATAKQLPFSAPLPPHTLPVHTLLLSSVAPSGESDEKN